MGVVSVVQCVDMKTLVPLLILAAWLLPGSSHAQYRVPQQVYYYSYYNQALTVAAPVYGTGPAAAPLKDAVVWRVRMWPNAGQFAGGGGFLAYGVLGRGTVLDPYRFFRMKDVDCDLTAAAGADTWFCGDYPVVGYASNSPMAILYVPTGVTLQGGGTSVSAVVEVVTQ